jgi:arabinofuranosyltransferase
VVLPWQRCDPFVRIMLVTIVAVGLAMGGYVVLLGGDFMHARMLLPATFALLLPFMAVPAPRLAPAAWKPVVAFALVVGIAGVSAVKWRDDLGPGGAVDTGISDEHAYWVMFTQVGHPVDPAPFLKHANPELIADTKRALAAGKPVLLYATVDGHWATAPLNRPGAPIAVNWWVLGSLGALVPLDGIAVDNKGLSYPLVAHSDLIPHDRVGHSKQLSPDWILADYAGLTDNPDQAAAAKALTCGKLADVRTATTAPLTAGRFVDNLFGSLDLTSFRFHRDPQLAEHQLCG